MTHVCSPLFPLSLFASHHHHLYFISPPVRMEFTHGCEKFSRPPTNRYQKKSIQGCFYSSCVRSVFTTDFYITVSFYVHLKCSSLGRRESTWIFLPSYTHESEV